MEPILKETFLNEQEKTKVQSDTSKEICNLKQSDFNVTLSQNKLGLASFLKGCMTKDTNNAEIERYFKLTASKIQADSPEW